MTEFFFEAHELKAMLEEARKINSILVERHAYSKYEAKLDFFEGMFCADYLTNQQFNRMAFKYIGEGSELATARNQISMRNIMKDRLQNLGASRETISRQWHKINELLENGMHKKIKRGEIELF